MRYFRSENEAAIYALMELAQYVPKEPDDNGKEKGVMIYKYEDSEHGCLYMYGAPDENKSKSVREYEPPPPPPFKSGWKEVALVHTHPNDTGFSGEDEKLARQQEYTFYMVTQSGAYWYEGKPEFKPYGNKSHYRYGTLWGTQYPWSFYKSTEKINGN